ncbi:type II toxin-antitoxin system Phd/YefM family antitoxin [Nocardia pneumoniae]|uniref:type II toxin-antitoxin system Phd/YefM family antitoxin n=1 Tax=Nocardia pneumoniae TaxID=228601 RepID=UPI0012F6BC0D|nr:type II toxin-antitoxin system Phd/YefM family antitoxin [Nocardia pneumoniae]
MAELAYDRPTQIPTLSFTEARARFTEIVGRAEYAKVPTVITKRGREVAVVMPVEALSYLLARLPRDSGRKSIAETIERLAEIGAGTGLTHEQVIEAIREVREDDE